MRERKETIKPGLYFVFLILLLVSACAPEATLTNDEDSTSEDSPFAHLSEKEISSEESPFADLLEKISHDRKRALQRAKEWVDAEVPYSKTPQPDWENYRADCSGYVSYAWELGARGETTRTLPNVATLIRVEDLKPADIILDNSPNFNHVILFVRWTNKASLTFRAYEEVGDFYERAVARDLSFEKREDGWYVVDEDSISFGPYIAMRMDKTLKGEGEVKGASDVQDGGQPADKMDQKVSPVDGKTMIYIPAGEFSMGNTVDKVLQLCQKYYDPNNFLGGSCQREWFVEEEPIHTVYLDAYWIDQTEVTNAQYQQCMEAGVCTGEPYGFPFQRGDCPAGLDDPGCEAETYFGSPEYASYPVVDVTWFDAVTYCEWAGKRLPTEAEWEKAARGTQALNFPWGDAFLEKRANFCSLNCFSPQANEAYDDGYGNFSPVGTYPDGASPYGVLDMAGNAVEWTADWYSMGYYEHSPYKNPVGPEDGDARVLRGGSAFSIPSDVRITRRVKMAPETQSAGFRCVQEVKP